MTAHRTALAAAIVLTLALIAAEALLAKTMYPLGRGTSTEFWAIAAQVNLGVTDLTFGGDVHIDGDQAAYSPITMDAMWSYWLPRSEVEADLPRVLAVLEARAAAGGDSPFADAYRHWITLDPSARDLRNLLRCLNDAQVRYQVNRADLSPGYASASTSGYRASVLQQHVLKARHYWANIAFELAHMGGLIWFCLWPVIRRKNFLRLVLHLILAPFILFAPAWLGYCSVSANGVGPAGGIVYCWVAAAAHVDNAPWDFAFFRAIPKPLDVLNQSPQWGFDEMLAVWGDTRTVPGPVLTAIFSAVLASAMFALRKIAYRMRLRRHQRPGFEVLLTTPSNTTAESVPPDQVSPSRSAKRPAHFG